MDGQVETIELVERAQRGDQQSLNTLAGIARERLRVYVYRLTQQDDLTQEIVQESLLEMCKVLGKLQRADRFWSWLYGIATNKLHRHYRTERAAQHAAASEERRRGSMKERQGAFENLVSQELKQIVSAAMQKLRTRHKAVLVMRCYDGMSYSEIAESMGCSEFSTRMLFMRAKQALQKELSRNGFGKGSLLAALVVFGKITAPSEAAAELTVPAAAMKVGVLAGAAAVVTTKTALVSMTAAGALAVGTVAVTYNAQVGEPTPAPAVISSFAARGTGRQAYWYYFPGEPSGAVMLRATSGTDADNPDRTLLQNAHGNYSYKGSTVSINNYHMWMKDLSVLTLPTDNSEMKAFLARMGSTNYTMQPVATKERGLLVGVEQNGQSPSSQPWAVRHYSGVDEDYFQTDWPADATIVDTRDAMHQRGWTCFRIRGQINGRNVTGAGRMPFIYAEAREHNAWLKLQIADNLTIVDSETSASVTDAKGAVVGRYARGSFFRGLARPWMGLHAMDTVRRDAAARKIPFQTDRTPDGKDVLVTVAREQTKLVYTIDLETDVVKSIAFFVGDVPVGQLEFEYLQDLPETGGEFAVPRGIGSRGSSSQDEGMLWLVKLADGTLARSIP